MLPDLTELTISDWRVKVRQPPQDAKRVILLIHGWTGDENSMWVFASRLPKDALLVAPRGPYTSKHHELAGYSWVEERAGSFSSLAMFAPALQAFDGLLTELAARYPVADFSHLGLVGFSQGAAFSAALAMRHPQQVSRLAMLAGFLPEQSGSLAALAGLPVFIAHGAKDETVPLERAQAASQQLAAAGAQVTYCESEVGHKLGANCATQLTEFFSA